MSFPWSSFLNQRDVRETATAPKPIGYVKYDTWSTLANSGEGEKLSKSFQIVANQGDNIKININLETIPGNANLTIKLKKGTTTLQERVIYSEQEKEFIEILYLDENVSGGTQTYNLYVETAKATNTLAVFRAYAILEKLK